MEKDISQNLNARKRKKAIVAVCIAVPVGLLHFVTGPGYRGPFPLFVNGYLIDILLPFAFYFLLCPQDTITPFLRPWIVKAVPVVVAAFSVETAQFFGVEIFGCTFDPLDYAAYVFGVGLAVVFDRVILTRLFPFWAHRVESATH